MNGVENVAVVAGQHVIAMEQHGGADADRDAVDRGDDRLDVVRQRIKEFRRRWRRAACRSLEVPSFRKSSRSLPAVNTPEPPVMMMQRIVRIVLRGVDRIAHGAIHVLRDRVLLFGPPQPDHPRRVFVGDYQMIGHGTVLERGEALRLASYAHAILHDPLTRPKPLRPGFPGDGMMRERSSAMQLTGIHHLTAISAKPRENLAFYTGLLGMRLVKKTVNQDDVSAYHLFYADGKANPGTDLTFFDFPAAPERRGTNSISRTGLRVAGEKSLGYWRDRLKQGRRPYRRCRRSRRPADAAVRGRRRPTAGAGR